MAEVRVVSLLKISAQFLKARFNAESIVMRRGGSLNFAIMKSFQWTRLVLYF